MNVIVKNVVDTIEKGMKMSGELIVPRGAAECPLCGAKLELVKILEMSDTLPTVECSNHHFWMRNLESTGVDDYWIECSVKRIQ